MTFREKMPRDRLYIHIGLGKAGSSAIQLFLHENRQILARYGFRYPDRRTHPLLAHKWGGGWMKAEALEKSNPDREWKNLRKFVEESNDAFIISCERFTGATVEAEGVPAFISELFAGVPTKIVIYLRRQGDLAESEYKQRIRNGERMAFDQFLSALPRYFDYDALLRPWADAFGAKNIIVRRYAATGLIGDFLEMVGIPRTLPFVAEEKRVNLSISGVSAEKFLRLGSEELIRAEVERIRADHDTDDRRLLTFEQLDALRRDYEQSNRAVAMTYLDVPALFD